jgi:hypothetical protein
MNNTGILGGQNQVDYLWVVEKAGTKKASGKDAKASFEVQSDGTYKITMRANMTQTGCECVKVKSFVLNRASKSNLAKFKPSIQPNPSNGMFNLEGLIADGNPVKVAVYSMTGQVVWENTITSAESIPVNLQVLSDGVYTISVKHNQQIHNEKIVITK